MKLLYATTISFPSGLANRMHVIAMAKAYGARLGNDFYLAGKDIKVPGANFKIFNFDSSRSFLFAWRYLKFAKNGKIDFIHCREPRLMFYMLVYNKVVLRFPVKFVYEIHRVIERGVIDKIMENFISFLADKYIFVTGYLKKIYSEKYSLSGDVGVVAPDGVDMKIFDINISKQKAREQLGIPARNPVIGYCGRFMTMGDEKGLKEVMGALGYLSENVIFVAMGGKPRHVEYYKNVVKDMGLGSRAIIRDHQTQDIVALYQKAFDILLMPFPKTMHYEYFMSPMKMFEYMAARRPIVASDLPSVREVLNESNAVLVKPDDPESLACGIKKVLEDTEFAKKIAKQAYQDSHKYTWEKRVERILNHIK